MKNKEDNYEQLTSDLDPGDGLNKATSKSGTGTLQLMQIGT